jgi:hypothetical protein
MALGTNNALVATGWENSLVLKTMGVVFAFGRGGSGQLGLGTYSNRNSLAEVMALGTNNALVATRASHSLVLKTMGVVFAFGYGYYGQLGLGTTDSQLSPVEVTALGTDNAMVVAREQHSLVVKGATPYTLCGTFNVGCGCPPSEYDHDLDPTTTCLVCQPGNATDTLALTNAIVCTTCAPGQYDDDLDSTTVCVACSLGAHAIWPARARPPRA